MHFSKISNEKKDCIPYYQCMPSEYERKLTEVSKSTRVDFAN